MKLALPCFFKRNLAAKGAAFIAFAFLCGLFNKQIAELIPHAWNILGAVATWIILLLYLLCTLAGATIFASLFLAMTPIGGLALLLLLRPKPTK